MKRESVRGGRKLASKLQSKDVKKGTAAQKPKRKQAVKKKPSVAKKVLKKVAKTALRAVPVGAAYAVGEYASTGIQIAARARAKSIKNSSGVNSKATEKKRTVKTKNVQKAYRNAKGTNVSMAKGVTANMKMRKARLRKK